jgi:hypothetical protein
MRRLHRDERGQSLPVVLALVTILFLMGTALAAHTSAALRATVANESQAADLHAADAGAELGMWWQRNGNLGNPPPITVNGLTVNTTVGVAGTVPCVTRSPIKLTGFEHGAVSSAGGGIFSAVVGGGLSADAGVARTGSYSLRVNDPAGSRSYASVTVGAATAVLRAYVRLAALPGGNVAELLKLDATGGNDLLLGYQASSQRLTIRLGTGPLTVASSTVTAGTWFRIDMRFIASTNPRTADWEIDGVAQTAISRTGTGSTVGTLRLGSTVTADNFTANYDDLLISSTSADYPIGAGTVVGLRPDGMGTHVTAASFRNNGGSAIDANTYQRLDEAPMSSFADYVMQLNNGTNDYVELTFGDTTETCVVGVSGLVAYHSATNSRNDGGTRIVDGAAQRVVYDGDMSVTTPAQYRSVIVAPAAAPWTPAAVNGLLARVGYSSDANPDPYWDGLLLEVATGVSVPGTVTVRSTAGGSTVTTTYTDAGSSSPTLLTWSTTR